MASEAIVPCAPKEVTLLHRQVGSRHIFSCAELKGLHYGVDGLSEGTYKSALAALSVHASAYCGKSVKYAMSKSFEEFAGDIATFAQATLVE